MLDGTALALAAWLLATSRARPPDREPTPAGTAEAKGIDVLGMTLSTVVVRAGPSEAWGRRHPPRRPTI
jgi:hypothetical protein